MEELKKIAGVTAAKYVEDGMVVGLGTGSTAYFFVEEIGRRIKEEGLSVVGVTTSSQTTKQAEGLGIPLKAVDDIDSIDVTVDNQTLTLSNVIANNITPIYVNGSYTGSYNDGTINKPFKTVNIELGDTEGKTKYVLYNQLKNYVLVDNTGIIRGMKPSKEWKKEVFRRGGSGTKVEVEEVELWVY